jgi:pimeloyl-ACP methyl ester carboxylesterase
MTYQLTGGYGHVRAAGISLGGFGALLYASRYPEEVTGILAVAPFLGGTWRRL